MERDGWRKEVQRHLPCSKSGGKLKRERNGSWATVYICFFFSSMYVRTYVLLPRYILVNWWCLRNFHKKKPCYGNEVANRILKQHLLDQFLFSSRACGMHLTIMVMALREVMIYDILESLWSWCFRWTSSSESYDPALNRPKSIEANTRLVSWFIIYGILSWGLWILKLSMMRLSASHGGVDRRFFFFFVDEIKSHDLRRVG